jgi:hypothetical protein
MRTGRSRQYLLRVPSPGGGTTTNDASALLSRLQRLIGASVPISYMQRLVLLNGHNLSIHNLLIIALGGAQLHFSFRFLLHQL